MTEHIKIFNSQHHTLWFTMLLGTWSTVWPAMRLWSRPATLTTSAGSGGGACFGGSSAMSGPVHCPMGSTCRYPYGFGLVWEKRDTAGPKGHRRQTQAGPTKIHPERSLKKFLRRAAHSHHTTQNAACGSLKMCRLWNLFNEILLSNHKFIPLTYYLLTTDTCWKDPLLS